MGDESERDWLRPRLSVLLGETSTATFTREDLFSAWTAFFERVGGGDPVVLVIDDAQHADDSLLDFVDHLLSTARFGIFVLAIARPELLDRRPGLGGRRTSVIRLSPLDDASMSALVDRLVLGLSPGHADGSGHACRGHPTVRGRDCSCPDRPRCRPPPRRSLRRGRRGRCEPRWARRAGIAAGSGRRSPRCAHGGGTPRRDRRQCAGTFVHPRRTGGDRSDHRCPRRRARLVAAHARSSASSRTDDPQSAGSITFVQGVVRQVAYATQSKRDRKARHLAAADVPRGARRRERGPVDRGGPAPARRRGCLVARRRRRRRADDAGARTPRARGPALGRSCRADRGRPAVPSRA